VLGPRAVYGTKFRQVCPKCRYDLEGLPAQGTCPECGGFYYEKVVERVGWKFQWWIIPRILVAMLVPALGPFISVSLLAWIMMARYGWTWEIAWFQSSERDLSTAVIFTLPYLLNSWVLIGLPKKGSVEHGSKLRGVDAEGCWRSLVLSTLTGSVAMSSVGAVAWIDRVYFDALFLYILALGLVIAAMGVGHWVARILGPFWKSGPQGELATVEQGPAAPDR
jgi:hypothetical protein